MGRSPPILHVRQLESWMKSYKHEELFDRDGRLIAELAEPAPQGDCRVGADPHTNGSLLRDLRMPDFHARAVYVPAPGAMAGQDTIVLGRFLSDVVRLNQDHRNFRVFGSDETLSNLLGAVFDSTDRQWDARVEANDQFRAPAGRVVDSMLSEDHYAHGGLSDAVLSGLATENVRAHKLAVRVIPHSGKAEALMEKFGISSSHIVNAVKSALR